MLFEDNDFDINLALFIPDINIDKDNNLLNPMEGFLRGNSFLNEYVPYKNLTYLKLIPSNDKELDLYKIMALSFAITDLNLYLDIHPENKDMFIKLKKYLKEKEELTCEYNKNYGALEINQIGDRYNWITSPWPWDNEGDSKYV